MLSDELFQPDVERRLNAQGVTSSFITTSFTTSFTARRAFTPDVERRLNAQGMFEMFVTHDDVC